MGVGQEMDTLHYRYMEKDPVIKLKEIIADTLW